MDVLSSQANIAGYKAVVLAAHLYPKYFPMLMTAAGSIAPAKMLILGAGVAGLQAIATSRRLGAVVEVFDTRPAVKEEVMSLGAKFIEVEGAADSSKAGGMRLIKPKSINRNNNRKFQKLQRRPTLYYHSPNSGKAAPVLLTEASLNVMKPGSIIIDPGSHATGGNTARTVNNEAVVYNGVTIVGNNNLASSMPADASKLYGRNLLNF